MQMIPETRQPSLKERQRSEREQLIMQAAYELLLERGYRDTSLDDIAARVGISKGTIYLHFSSKEELVAAIFDRGARAMHETLDAILASPGTPREKLDAVIKQFYGNMGGARLQLMGALISSPEFHRHLAECRRGKQDQWAETRRRVGELFEEGKAQGEFSRAIPTSVLQSLFWSMLTPHTFRQLVTDEQFPASALAEYVSQVFFQGILTVSERRAQWADR